MLRNVRFLKQRVYPDINPIELQFKHLGETMEDTAILNRLGLSDGSVIEVIRVDGDRINSLRHQDMARVDLAEMMMERILNAAPEERR